MRAAERLRRIPAGPLIAVAAVAGLWSMSTGSDALTEVPPLVGHPVQTAQTAAAELGFTTRIVVREGPGRPGTVLAQSPVAGQHLARGSPIELSVSKGARQVEVPDVRGMPVAEAQRLLRSAGVTVGDVIFRESPGAEPGRVLSTEPRHGATVDAGTLVDVVAAT